LKNPAELLSGHILEGGWTVGKLIDIPTGKTGGNFSIGYEVKSRDGKPAFLKALDYYSAFRDPNTPVALKRLVDIHLFEKRVLEICKEANLDHVVKFIAGGKVKVNESLIGEVDYIIFEMANSDIRTQMDRFQKLDLAWRLRAIHHISIGVQQLQGKGIVRQDIKPSNVLSFEDGFFKLGDLGSSVARDFSSPLEDRPIGGQISYASPELRYGYVSPDWGKRRLACDLYLLGSMLFFLFAKTSASALLFAEMREEHCPAKWGGSYGEVLPMVRDAFGRSMERFKSHIPDPFQSEISEIAGQLCNPDPDLRGHPRNRIGHGNPYSVERFVTRFDLLAFKALVNLKRS